MTEPTRAGRPPRERPAGSWDGLAVIVGAFLLVVMVGTSHGGYHPTAWGWTSLVLAWVAALALILTPRLRFGRLGLAFLTSLSLVIAWTALSILWSSDVEESVLDVQRGLVYLSGALAALLLVRADRIAHLLGGLLGATALLSTQALAGRLSPDAGPGVELIFQDRLDGLLGYANALGLLAVMGALLALGFAVYATRLPLRAAAGAALPILLTTLYFTYSRGAFVALAAGVLAAVAVDRRRLTLLTSGILVVAPSAAALWIASRFPALTGFTASPTEIADEGRELALVLLAAAVGSAAIAVVTGVLEPRVRVPRGARRACAAVLAGAAVVLVAGTVMHFGGPGELVRTAGENIGRDYQPTGAEINELNPRLGSIGSTARIQYWRVAWDQYEEHPLVGSGAGTFEQFWLRNRPVNEHARDAHSLYLETLAQLGWPGLLFLVSMLALPVAAAVRARTDPLAVGAFGAYVAYVAHTGVDWDWEMPVLTLLALLCAAALLAAGRDHRTEGWLMPPAWRAAGVAAIIAVAALSVIGLVGNRALADADEALDRADHRAGERAAQTAVRWAPWSAEARGLLGRARFGLGREKEGRAELLEAARMNPRDWRIWYHVGVVSRGRERQRAFARAATLNPMEPDIELLRDQGYRLPRSRAQG